MPRPHRSAKKPPETGQVRIIGGQWRGRKLTFPAVPGLRPTPDRVRETLFNWLAPYIEGARCLDLFAGSGALGLEALSRGAGFCQFVESNREAVASLRAHLQRLGTDRAEVACSEAAAFLKTPPPQPYDVVFLDPPFRDSPINETAAALVAANSLSHEAWIYIEMAVTEQAPAVPPEWTLYRNKVAGDVAYRLYRSPSLTTSPNAG